MTFEDLERSMAQFTRLGAEAARQNAVINARALYLRTRRPIGLILARRVALFSLGTWAQRYPVQSHDLGRDAALFIVDWLAARGVDSEDAMHEAPMDWWTQRWRALGEPLSVEREQMKAALAKLAEAGAQPKAETAGATRPLNRHERRRARSRRWTR